MLKHWFSKIPIALLCVFCVLILPEQSMGYWITDEQTIQIDAHSMVSVTTYREGDSDMTLGMPTRATRKGYEPAQLDDPHLIYGIKKDNGDIYTEGQVSTVILSTGTHIQNNTYVVEGGFSREFVLITVLYDVADINVSDLSIFIDEISSTNLSESE